MKLTCILSVLLSIATAPLMAEQASAGSPHPPMGWNSWNWHGKKHINETVVRETIDAMVSSGLRDAGYLNVIIDGGWRGTELGPNGELTVNAERFPGGIKPLADYAHAHGMKLGLHTVPGTHDCGGDAVGGYGHEEVHVAQFAEWGIDFVKLDRCVFKEGDGWNEELIEEVYRKWARLMAKSEHPMTLSISAYEYRDWYPEIGAMARTTLDIVARGKGGAVFERETPQRNHISVMQVADLNNAHAASAGNGYWNDPDMLVTGEQGLTDAEQEAHFALWCVMSSPLMLGNDPRSMTAFEQDLITNKVAIAINQDPTEQGRRIAKSGMAEIWVKNLSDNQLAILLLNRGTERMEDFQFDAGAMLSGSEFQVTDVFGKYSTNFGGLLEAELGPRSSKFYLVDGR
ncbi:MAG: glycoside hydrolase family 27 protein [Opitutaceae bacterium]|tara:strand:+ start:4867 stop:6069 length:1203 start_codon:yes stop_codon:yes gene_type:complete